ncbi:MAG: thiolase family protein [Proteobacteria bacterium]|nr:thiolase family protein [Pseudomonadota bacterium]
MDNEVAIIGLGQTEYRPVNPHQNATEMVLDAVELALADASLELADVDGVVTASIDLWDGRTASNFYLTEVVGSVLKPETRVAGDGTLAVYQAVINLLTGEYEKVLVVSSSKGSEADHEAISNWVFDPIYQQPLGLDYLVAAALQARAYMNQYDVSPESWARVVTKNRANGAHNPRAMRQKVVSLEEVLDSGMRASPLREPDVAPTGDGACALVMARKEAVDQSRHRPVWLKGMANVLGAHYLGDRPLFKDETLQMAAIKAYRMAGVDDPRRDLDVVELSEYYSYQELMWSESLGLCPFGQGADLLFSGETGREGKMPVNPSGGLISGSPFVVGGMARVLECAVQLRGEAGGAQLQKISRALAHGTTGPCGQGHCVLILGR